MIVLVDRGKIGTESQVLGIIQALGFLYQIKYINNRYDSIQLPSKPTIIVAAGSKSTSVASKIKKINPEHYVIAFQDPRISLDKFDLVIAPEHDNLYGENVISTQGVIHKVTNSLLSESKEKWTKFFSSFKRPTIGVLLGGNSKHYSLTYGVSSSFVCGHYSFIPCIESRFATFSNELINLDKHGYGVFLVPSRRTPDWLLKSLSDKFANTDIRIWDRISENPYIGTLSCCDFLVVTSDSATMISEAVSTGKPVYIFELYGTSKKLDSLRDGFYRREQAKPWNGKLTKFTSNCEYNNSFTQVINDIKKRLEQWTYLKKK